MKIPILRGSHFDISKFDFTSHKVEILNIESQEYEKYIEKLNPQAKDYNLRWTKEIIKENEHNSGSSFAIVCTDRIEHFSISKVYDVWKFLLILYPSDLNIQYELHVNSEEGFSQISSYTTYETRTTGEYPGELLICIDSIVPEVNVFIEKYFNSLTTEGFLRLAVESYTTSYYSSHSQHKYLQLMMALESILEGNNELSYRLRRSIAVLLGDDVTSCRLIFDNLNKLYDLRSKIIHGENFNYDAINKYLPCLKGIVSKVITELMIHNFPTRKELNQKIDELGFGSKNQISKNWVQTNINPIRDLEVQLKGLEKIKTAGNMH